MQTANFRYLGVRFTLAPMLLLLVALALLTVSEAQSAPKSYDETVAEARKLLTQMKAQEAVARSEAAIRLDDKRWEAYVTAASGYSEQKLYDDAVGMLQMALVRAPQDKKPLVRDAIAEARRSATGATTAASAATMPSTPTAGAPTQAEIVLWKSIENSARMEDFRAYLEKYPSGTFVPLATVRVEKMKADEDARQSERAKRGIAVAYTRGLVRVQSTSLLGSAHYDPDRTDGYLQIEADGASFRGAGDFVSFSKADVTYVDMSDPDVRFFSKKHSWNFMPKEKTPMQVVDLVVAKWGFVPAKNGNGNRFVPPGR